MESEIVSVDFDLNAVGGYERFIDMFRDKLARHRQRDEYIAMHGPWLVDHPLLPEQRTPKPARWMHINLTEKDANTGDVRRTTVIVRDDNVFVVGFQNRNRDYFEFGIDNRSTHIIPEPDHLNNDQEPAKLFFLGCDADYPDLVGCKGNLADLDLGKEAMTRAVRTLWAYTNIKGPADTATRKDLARVCVVIAESARMASHFDTVRTGWNTQGSRINLTQVRYVDTWSKMSRALIKCAKENLENLRTHPAFDVLHLLLNSPGAQRKQRKQQDRQEQSPVTPEGGGPSQEQPGSGPRLQPPASRGGAGTQQHGRRAGKSVSTRPLVEVYRVKPVGGTTISTIVVFDGKRGQIIYKHDEHDESRSQGTSTADHAIYRDSLVLTGPYRAISADGSFVVKVDGILGTDSSSSQFVSADMFWDGYAEDVVYNRVVTTYPAISTNPSHPLASVTYAVWSDAVEATVEVNLLLHHAGITHVYGEITSLCQTTESRVLLFMRKEYEKVELVPSPDGSSMVPLQLGRSVVAVPMQLQTDKSRLRVYVRLHAMTPPPRPSNGEATVVDLAGDIDFYFDTHTGEIRVMIFDGIFVPLASSHPPVGSTSTELTSVPQCKVQVNITSPGFHVALPKPEPMVPIVSSQDA
ncbi:hypothetical protein CFC21_022629 [Triticum aestivum]|uniref:DUF6598 domain-containing protein n=2 Tax=Triticum aestivum TaxID=4565 RepID=A0A9R1INC9_WHEAT|nr:hypothetical protein CFC21_004677 [Triticum aestivum]KAF6987004.1 hypothetical protein CFC21_004679 [Triticum aestivum]KAF7007715.1 hypothetical protein CFC21_022629 [Triticum aestivum]